MNRFFDLYLRFTTLIPMPRRVHPVLARIIVLPVAFTPASLCIHAGLTQSEQVKGILLTGLGVLYALPMLALLWWMWRVLPKDLATYRAKALSPPSS